MKIQFPTAVNYTAFSLALLLGGAACKKSTSEAPPPLPPEQIETVVTQALSRADAAAQSQLHQYLADLKTNDIPAAFVDLVELRSRPDLTLDQRAVLGRVMMTTSQKLREAADGGDARAAQVLHDYLASHRRVERPVNTASNQSPTSSPSPNP